MPEKDPILKFALILSIGCFLTNVILWCIYPNPKGRAGRDGTSVTDWPSNRSLSQPTETLTETGGTLLIQGIVPITTQLPALEAGKPQGYIVRLPNALQNLDYQQSSALPTTSAVSDSLYVYLAVGATGRIQGISKSSDQLLIRFSRQNGSIDKTFTPTFTVTSGSASVTALAVNSAHLYIAGNFTRVGTVSIAYLCRISLSDSMLDDSWRPSVPSAPTALQVVNDNILFVGGSSYLRKFTSADATSQSDFSVTVNGVVNALAYEDPYLYLGGDFTIVNGVNMPLIARCDVSGSLQPDWSLDENSSSGAVQWIQLSADYVYLAGTFSITDDYATYTRVARQPKTFNSRLDSSWNPGPSSTLNGFVVDGSYVAIGGDFSGASAEPTLYCDGLLLYDTSTEPPTRMDNPLANHSYLSTATAVKHLSKVSDGYWFMQCQNTSLLNVNYENMGNWGFFALASQIVFASAQPSTKLHLRYPGLYLISSSSSSEEWLLNLIGK